MPQTYRDYRVMEASVCLFHGGTLESGHERARRGDIVNIRDISAGTGLNVAKRYLFVPIVGLDLYEMHDLQRPHEDGQYEKKRYAIPLHRLKQTYPALDINKLRDLDLIYQPFFLVDEETGLFLSYSPPFNVHGLVFDKLTGRYL